MAGDSEKRFQKVMDKLYHVSTSAPARGRRAVGVLRGGLEKRLRVPTAPTVGHLGLEPPCRPWDRGDVMRRLTTFKAMTWFAKPKAISPVNCARRGWINVEMDTIGCEACGARLLFTTPSSWTVQQVENAAAVFSLKLDNGHKLLCPWINNACDETLAFFPPTPPPVLVEGYKDRYSALLRLSALPLISSSATDYMKCPQIEHFLLQSPHLSVTLNSGIRWTDGYGSEGLEGASEAATSNLYYQALKIISLCGWEPRVLPYIVDCEDHSKPPAEDSHPSGSSRHIHGGQKGGFTIYSSAASDEVEREKDALPNLHEFQYDPASMVLDCRFCGACVGLWAFANVPRPLEIFSLVACADSHGDGESATHADLIGRTEAPGIEKLDTENQNSEKRTVDAVYSSMAAKESSLGLNLTIAGGPPPLKQYFRPKVSFPIINCHLRARFGSNSGIKNFLPSHLSYIDQSNTLCSSQNDKASQHQKDNSGGLVVWSEGMGSLKRKRRDDELKERLHGVGDDLGDDKTGNIFSVKGNNNKQEPNSFPVSNEVELQRESAQSRPEESLVTARADNSVKVGESQCTTSQVHLITGDAGGRENKFVTGSTNVLDQIDDAVLERDDNSGASESNNNDSTNIALCSANNVIVKGEANGLKNLLQSSVNTKSDAYHLSGNNSKPSVDHSVDEFDPIRQHRTFCPWITPVDGECMPGWKLTLSALYHKEKDLAQSFLLDDVDDPIISVRKLFMSPSTKRSKISK